MDVLPIESYQFIFNNLSLTNIKSLLNTRKLFTSIIDWDSYVKYNNK